ncbi:hypothetical protein K2X89_14710, partial [Myxococcota bacterium]|nr:hypothetical protein [Myxococcota bacterium]
MRSRSLRAGACASLLFAALATPIEASPRGEGDSGAAERSALYEPHRDDDGFFNPWRRFVRPSIGDLLTWKWADNPYDKKRPPVLPRIPNDGAYLAGVEHSATVTWVGHATFAVHDRED